MTAYELRIIDWSSDVCSSDLINGGQAYHKQIGISNDTSISFGSITVRNIFGYRHNWVDQLINTGATGPLFLPDGTQFSIFHAGEQYNREYLTEEIQVLGKFEGFDFIVGGFLSHDRSAGAMGSTFGAFAVGDVPGVPVTAHVR